MCLKESCFPYRWKVSSVIPAFVNISEKSLATNCCSASLCVLGKMCQKSENNRLVDHHQKCGLFCNFYYGFRSSSSTLHLLKLAANRIIWTFNIFCAYWSYTVMIFLMMLSVILLSRLIICPPLKLSSGV